MNIAHAVLAEVQRRLGAELRRRVAGDDAATRAARIWGTEGERWFDETDPISRVHGDAAMYPAGITALLLQSLHPLAMAGVAGHSGYRGDPWGRLQRTSEYIATTTFGTVEHAEDVIATVRTVHERVRGKDFRGRSYRASDPYLLRWVHVAEAWSFVHGYQTYGQTLLSPAEADLYVEQAARSATLLGAEDVPRTVAELEQQLEAFRPELEATPASREAARFMLLNPPLPLVARPAYGLIAAGGLALLPAWARGPLRLPWLPGAGVPTVLAGKASVAGVRWVMSGLSEDVGDD